MTIWWLWLTTVWCAVVLFTTLWIVGVTNNTPTDYLGRPLMSQESFPCEEDEVLGFGGAELFHGVRGTDAYTASRDYVTCIPREAFK